MKRPYPDPVTSPKLVMGEDLGFNRQELTWINDRFTKGRISWRANRVLASRGNHLLPGEDRTPPAYCQSFATTKYDPWLPGHYTENELQWSLKMLDAHLNSPSADHGHIAATRWLTP